MVCAQNCGVGAASAKQDWAEKPGEAFNRLAAGKGWSARCDSALAFERQELAGIADLWRSKAAHGLPKRSDFSARELLTYMPQLALFEAAGEQRFRFRLLGTALMRIYGEATGRFVDEHFSPLVAEVWAASLTTTLKAGVPLRYKGRVTHEKSDFFRVESVQMPLSECGGAADRVMLVMYLLEGPAQGV
jgi:hypothetical protein